jgi:hypothetical protein
MHIDAHSGAITLPNGFAVTANLTQAAFRESEMFAHARAEQAGTLPWIHYQFSAGHLEGKELLVNLQFYDQMLVSVSVTADLYPPGPKDWSNYSLDVEAATKDFHDRLLERQLGAAESPQVSAARLTPTQAALARPRNWAFAWGAVASIHDTKGGGTFILVQYGNRREEADRAYRERRPG